MQKHVEAWSIYEVDLRALPLSVGDGIRHRGAAGHILFVVRRHRRSIFNSATRGRHLRCMQQSCNQRSFAAVRVAHYSHVPNVLSQVIFHCMLLKEDVEVAAKWVTECGLQL
jgi:hypothetical protein